MSDKTFGRASRFLATARSTLASGSPERMAGTTGQVSRGHGGIAENNPFLIS